MAEALVRSNHNITIVDPHEELLKMMESHSDLMTITGDSTSTAVLQRANVKKADRWTAVARRHCRTRDHLAAEEKRFIGDLRLRRR